MGNVKTSLAAHPFVVPIKCFIKNMTGIQCTVAPNYPVGSLAIRPVIANKQALCYGKGRKTYECKDEEEVKQSVFSEGKDRLHSAYYIPQDFERRT